MLKQSRDVYLFRMFLDRDEISGSSVSYEVSNSSNFLFTVVGLIIQIVI